LLYVIAVAGFPFVPFLPNKELAGILDPTQISHFCTVVKDFNASAMNFAKAFGGSPPLGSLTTDSWTYFKGVPTDARSILVHVPIGKPGSGVAWEILQPADDYPSFWRQLLEENGDFLHHVGVNVVDIDSTRASLEALGYKTVQAGQGSWGCYYYLDARPQLGVVLELLAPGVLNCSKPTF